MSVPVETASAQASNSEKRAPGPGQRLASLDALRGFDMFWIIGADAVVRAVAKLGDTGFTHSLDAQFEHVEWAGLHFYDMIYPLFLFLMGAAMVFSLDKTIEREGRGKALWRVVRRSVVLYALNFVYNGGFTTRWPDIRVISGVLAMIAASYLLAGIIYCFFGRSLRALAAIAVLLLAGNWAILGLVPFPDIHLDKPTVEALASKAGSHDPAAIAALVPQRVHGTYEAGYNVSNYLDFRYIPGKQALVYYENQGLLSPLTSVTLCLAGIFAARLLRSSTASQRRKVVVLAAAGVASIAVGALWSIELPIVKRLWTSSYCLVTAGYSAVMLAAFYQIVDVWNLQSWCRPFVWIGVNPITAYLLDAFVPFSKAATRLVGGTVKAWLDGMAKGLGAVVIAAVGLALLMLVMRFLYQRKIFIKV